MQSVGSAVGVGMFQAGFSEQQETGPPTPGLDVDELAWKKP